MLSRRLDYMRKFAAAAPSWAAVPALVVAANARCSPFAGASRVSAALGHIFGTLPIGTEATRGAYAWIDTHDLGDLVSAEEVLIDRTYDLARVPFAPDLIVDCGAHIGLFALIAGICFPQASVVAYEASPRNAAAARLQLQRFGARATVIEAAVIDHAGSVRFDADASNAGHISERLAGTATVAALDFHSECVRWSSRQLLLKMDIEGAEFRVLPRIIEVLPPACALFLELHEREGDTTALTASLDSAGFFIEVTRDRQDYKDVFAIRTDRERRA